MGTGLTTRPNASLQNFFEIQPFRALQEEVDDLLSRFAGDWEGSPLAGRLIPTVDMSETASTIEVRMDIPGMKAEEIDIELTGNQLRVKGERKESREEKGRNWHRTERRQGKFSRSMTLPCGVREKDVTTEFKDGVLTLTLPKSEESRTHKIAVKPA